MQKLVHTDVRINSAVLRLTDQPLQIVCGNTHAAFMSGSWHPAGCFTSS